MAVTRIEPKARAGLDAETLRQMCIRDRLSEVLSEAALAVSGEAIHI